LLRQLRHLFRQIHARKLREPAGWKKREVESVKADKKLSLQARSAGETVAGERLFLLGSGLRGDGGAFFIVGAADFRVLLRGFLLVRLRGFIAHGFDFLLRVDSPTA
jgi:hypothetical protein